MDHTSSNPTNPLIKNSEDSGYVEIMSDEPVYAEIDPAPISIDLSSASNFILSFPENYLNDLNENYNDPQKYTYTNYKVENKDIDLEGKYINNLDILKVSYTYYKNVIDNNINEEFIKNYGYISYDINDSKYHLIKHYEPMPLRFPHENNNYYYVYWVGETNQPPDSSKDLVKILNKLVEKKPFDNDDNYFYKSGTSEKNDNALIPKYALFETDFHDKYFYKILGYDEQGRELKREKTDKTFLKL